ncbi:MULTISPECIES: hypothetical protein [Pontibacillus]|uniref:DUF4352 domain-containing protein n=1 Tax=Pontibacillus chungwhensis TaxID=265426 RepID=A0ABY8UT27_9BACI|nr:MULTISPECIES: hypothetical protein [Pontibacillus]MCD5323447.1 hypothetical protein [Pontibacillus sp. HN14]WIF96825.1 hypothetical protein QNI29_13825 [Pontibacillus chungwhensis]
MKRIGLGIAAALLLAGCTDGDAVDELEQEKDELTQKMEQLEEENKDLQKQVKELTEQDKDKEQNDGEETNEQNKENESEDKETSTDQSSGLFSPESIEKGDQVAGLTVTSKEVDTESPSTAYFIDFEGQFTGKGNLALNEMGDDKYIFIINEDLNNVPHVQGNADKQEVYLHFENEQELEKALGEKATNLELGETAKVSVVLEQYSFNYAEGTDRSNYARFVELAE